MKFKCLEEDRDGTLHRTDPDRCCFIRKTLPLNRALGGFKVWVTGRKRFHGAERTSLPLVEFDGRHVKVNPLTDWSEDDINRYFLERDLPYHSLTLEGYGSIGCAPCTRPLEAGETGRAGRWAGLDKTECGIHLPPQAHTPL